jgi:hypothetical protein
MSAYWDSSAIVSGALEPEVRHALNATRPWCRPHVLTEVFSTLTGSRLGFRIDPASASALIAGIAANLRFVELTTDETLLALAAAQSRGVRGGRIHDFLHAKAARKAGCSHLVTLNLSDFQGLDPDLVIESP